MIEIWQISYLQGVLDVDLDCVKIFQNLRKNQEIGLGGGKPNFVNAKIVKPMSDKILQTLADESLKLLPS
jgi:hypothetical protein